MYLESAILLEFYVSLLKGTEIFVRCSNFHFFYLLIR